jgi:hypothetical protein
VLLMARIVYNTAEMRHLLEAPAGPVGQMLLNKSANVRKRAEDLAGQRLRRGPQRIAHQSYHDSFIHGLQPSPLLAFAGNTADIAMLVDVGSRKHVIRAKNAPYLHFPIDGRWVRVKTVNHPGTTAQHVLLDALQAVAE